VVNLIGHVTWAGAGQPQPHPFQQRPITLTLCYTDAAYVYTYPSSTDDSGYFTVTVGSLPTGAYRWWAKGFNSLATGGTFTLTGVTQQLEMGTQLGGDVTDDNLVSIADFNIVRSNFSTTDPRSDLNNDDIVNIGDFNILRANFNLAGIPFVCP